MKSRKNRLSQADSATGFDENQKHNKPFDVENQNASNVVALEKDLKYLKQNLRYIGIIVVGILVYFGINTYNGYNSFKKDIENTIIENLKKTIPIDSLVTKCNNFQNLIKSQQNTLDSLRKATQPITLIIPSSAFLRSSVILKPFKASATITDRKVNSNNKEVDLDVYSIIDSSNVISYSKPNRNELCTLIVSGLGKSPKIRN
jgi:hypothetical protein